MDLFRASQSLWGQFPPSHDVGMPLSSKTKTFLSFAFTLIPLFAGAMLIASYGGTEGLASQENSLAVGLFLFTPASRFFVNVCWIVYVIRQRGIEQTHKVFWSLGLLAEATAMMCAGAFGLLLSASGLVGMLCWYNHIYKPYKEERFYEAMQD